MLFQPRCQLQSSKTPVIHNYLLRSSHSQKVALLTSSGELCRVHTAWFWVKSVLVYTSDSHAVWIIKDAIWENRRCLWNIWHAKYLDVSTIHRAMWTHQQMNATPDSRAVWKQRWSGDFENSAVWTRHKAKTHKIKYFMCPVVGSITYFVAEINCFRKARCHAKCNV